MISPLSNRIVCCSIIFGMGLSASSHAQLSPVGQQGTPSNSAPPLPTLVPANLRCEYRVNPIGIDSPAPRLGWILHPSSPAARGITQTAYQILAASSKEMIAANKADLWNSGKVMSDQMSQIPYGGRKLNSNQRVWWKVVVWDQKGLPSVWSPIAQWTMGVLTEADWQSATWIAAPDANIKDEHKGPKPKYETVLLRRQFMVKAGLKSAIVSVCGLGQYELTLNGSKVGDDLMSPGWTRYDKTCLYDTYDITSALRAGPNTAGLFLGNGFYNIHGERYTKIQCSFGPLQAIALIRLEYTNGGIENVVTDDQWRVASGPITFSSIYGGEDFDARLATPGWDKPGFNDVSWEHPTLTKGPGGALKGLSSAAPPVRGFDVLTPVSKKAIHPNITVYDLGQNASLMLHLKLRGPAGASLKVIPAEQVKGDGNIDDPMCDGNSFWTYTLSGRNDEEYFSKFFYRGARYLKVELSAAPGGGLPEVQSIEGVTIHADAPSVGQFSCSNAVYNKVFTLIRWAQLNNMVSTLTDCPTREKLGWLEEDHLNGPALRYNFDLSTLLSKMVDDMEDSRRPNGLVPSTCPDFPRWGEGEFTNPPEWGSACIVVPWQQYQFEGDLELLRQHYDMMKGYVGYLSARANDDIVNFGLGDWYDNHSFGKATLTPISLTATAFYYYDARTLSEIAALLGKTDDATSYKQMAEKIFASFNQKFFNATTNNYATGSQASNAVPLAMNLVDPANRAAVTENLANDLKAKDTTVGEVCMEFLLRALADGGHSDLLYSTYASDKSGYGLQVKQGKTSLTEGWNGGASQDHFMFGQINEWFYRSLAGIQDDPTGPGFKKIIIKPTVTGDLSWVKASYDSIQGNIVSEWNLHGQTLTLHVVVPANSTATIYIPSRNGNSVAEGGRYAVQSPGVKFLKMDGRNAVFQAASGNYTFATNIN